MSRKSVALVALLFLAGLGAGALACSYRARVRSDRRVAWQQALVAEGEAAAAAGKTDADCPYPPAASDVTGLAARDGQTRRYWWMHGWMAESFRRNPPPPPPVEPPPSPAAADPLQLTDLPAGK